MIVLNVVFCLLFIGEVFGQTDITAGTPEASTTTGTGT